ncbi:Protease 4 [Buchnera aphidicola (Cinara kochiana kochiana)]|uniref:Protease 4 n=1 Tax=Buchnera aphidicola (Cinara kochiana kochiana) TaxID=2518976 RepID=A0A451D5K5_9GAMM|nr:signal peptide peptidase SppA [Buchnera aphidicola]VFP81092.1 Protease 4 [Buchnera aphidicola (Cinara kochiana kochiana)]
MSTLFILIIKMLKYAYKLLNIIKDLILNAILLLIIIVVIWTICSVKKNNIPETKEIPDKILVISPQDSMEELPILNKSQNNICPDFLNNFVKNKKNNSIFEITKKIKQAEKDPKILGIILKVNNTFNSNQVILEYFGKKLQEFKKSSKPIIAMGSSYSQSEYYLASFADKIFLSPHGCINLNGISNDKMFFKKFFDIFKIHMHIFKVGKYKGAVDPFLRNSPSKENKIIDKSIVRFKWKKFLEVIARNRHVPIKEICPYPDKIIKYLKKNNNNFVKYALHYHLIDHVVKNKNFTNCINHKFYDDQENHAHDFIDISEYQLHEKKIPSNPNKISIIIANGVIGQNSDQPNSMDVQYILNEINTAKNDDTVKAVILRINSPGGSTEYSEIIRQELIKLRKTKKPLIISMGDIAASGGYWIATAGDYIIAHPTTITGSIGIFSVIPTLEKLLSSIGVHNSRICTQQNHTFNIFNNLTLQDKKKIMLDVCSGYKKFINIVAQSRHKTNKDIQKIANGRIWLGIHAKQIGLVDQLGDIDVAIKKAAELSKIKDFNIVWPVPLCSISKNVTDKVNTLIKIISKNILRAFFSEVLVNNMFIIYNKIYFIWSIITSHQSISICLDNYTLK